MRDCYVMIDPCIAELDKYRELVLMSNFSTHDYGNGQVFHNMAELPDTPFSNFAQDFFPNYVLSGHFARKSPAGQLEPNYIHSDEMHGDITGILYLNPTNEGCGTILYNDDETPAVTVHMSYGRAFFFNSNIKHSRVLHNNFGEGDDARLIEVVFLKGLT